MFLFFFLNVFLVIWVYFFLIHVLPDHQFMCKIQISLENVLCMIPLGGRTYVGNYWKQRVLWIPLLPPISLPGLVQIGSGRILEQSYGQSKHSSTRQTLTESYAQPPEHQNVPRLHLHSRTQSLSELDFWIQELEVLTNSTSCISTTCRHPLGENAQIARFRVHQTRYSLRRLPNWFDW